MRTVTVIVPCYNEEESIPYFFAATQQVEAKLDYVFEYIFIDDGSSDQTLTTLKELHKQYPTTIHYLSFSRNFGKEAAIFAGLKRARGDLVTVMDADLQDPPELLIEMIERIESEQVDCIGTRRIDRSGEPLIRSLFAKFFYKMINKISDVQMIDGARDFRLMTRQMVQAILKVSEYNRFSKGIFSWVGFRTIYLSYENRERVAGKTSWNFWQLFKYSIDGIVNFSDAPLNIASFVGTVSFLISSIALVFIVLRALFFGDPVSGWPSLISTILFVGGIQLMCLGIIGKYIGKIFLETKNRPIYIVKETDQVDIVCENESERATLD